MSEHDRHTPVVDGEINLGRAAVLYHLEYGVLERAQGAERVGYAKFRIDQASDRLTVEWSAEELAELWERELFENPLHADEILTTRESNE